MLEGVHFMKKRRRLLVLMMKRVYFIALAVKWEEMQLHFLKNIIIFLFLESIKFLSNYLGLDLNFENPLDENINKKN